MKSPCYLPDLHANLKARFIPELTGIQPNLLIKLNGSNYLFHRKKLYMFRELEIEQLKKAVD